jgi:hypothetical protein
MLAAELLIQDFGFSSSGGNGVSPTSPAIAPGLPAITNKDDVLSQVGVCAGCGATLTHNAASIKHSQWQSRRRGDRCRGVGHHRVGDRVRRLATAEVNAALTRATNVK